MTENNGFFTKKSRWTFYFILGCLVINVCVSQLSLDYTTAHSPLATPKELFTIYNTSQPIIDGKIEFTPANLSGEWSSAAVYDLYNNLNLPEGKLLLQNDDNYLFLALDMISFQNSNPFTNWGMFASFDVDQNGLLSDNDCQLVFFTNSTTSYVFFHKPNNDNSQWELVESTSPGINFTNDILVDSDFTFSAFEPNNQHRQYELVIPLSILGISPGEIIGFGVEATTAVSNNNARVTWPYVNDASIMRVTPDLWGDLYICDDSAVPTDYIIEDNFGIKPLAIGSNNGTVLALGDINGDDDQELVVGSNRTVDGTYYLAIFDYNNLTNKITRVWESWTHTDHDSRMFPVYAIICYDFDGNGEDEIYITGDSQYILKFTSWGQVTKDFGISEYVFDNLDPIYGAFAIGDATNNFDMNLVVGDNLGYTAILEYRTNQEDFVKWDGAWYALADINSSLVTWVKDIELGDMDGDGWIEILYLSQFDSSIAGSTGLSIYENDDSSFYDNPTSSEDDLNLGSHPNTFDRYGHTLVIADVDNDGVNETVIAGKDYVKIFGQYNFNDATIPLVLKTNDGLAKPKMGGGAAVFDIDDDTDNELIIGCNNGTVIIYDIVDTNIDPDENDFIITEEWRGDLGATPGFASSILGYDIDQDGDTEAIIADNYGQILVLGKGKEPEVSITSPSPGSSSSQETITLQWSATDDSTSLHYFEIRDGSNNLLARPGGGQRRYNIQLALGFNVLTIYAFDFTGQSDFDTISIEYEQDAPEVAITSPVNFYQTSDSLLTVEYNVTDNQGDDYSVAVYVNGTQYTPSVPGSCDVSFDQGDGVYNISVIATDENNKVGKANIFVIFDTTAPEIIILSPENNDALNQEIVELSWSAFDTLTDINFFRIYRDSDFIADTNEYSFDIPLPFDKEYTLEVIAFDDVGNFDSVSIDIIRDSVKPTIALDSLSYETANGLYLTSNPMLFFSWNASDNSGGSGIDSFELTINSQFYSSFNAADRNATINLGTEGHKEIVLSVIDNAGNIAYDYYLIALDTSNPNVVIVNPENNYETSRDTVNINWDAYDVGTGIKEQILFVDGLEVARTTDPNIDSYIIDIPENKSYTITVRVVDFLDQYFEDTIIVTHNPFAETFYIEYPLDTSSYSTSVEQDVSWFISNIDADEFRIFVNDSQVDNVNDTTYNYHIDFEAILGTVIPEDSFPTFNVTIAVIVNGSIYFVDQRWITIDQFIPRVSILNLINGSLILDNFLNVKWSSDESGSGLDYYILRLDNQVIGHFSSDTTSQYYDISEIINGAYNLTLEAYDHAGNVGIKSIIIEMYPSAPGFEINIPELFITNNPNFELDINISAPRYGVKMVQVIIDNDNIVYSQDYGTDIQYDPFIIQVDINELDFNPLFIQNNITVIVFDKANRGSVQSVNMIIDTIDPDLFTNPTIDGNQVLIETGFTFTIYKDSNKNNHTITVFASDANGIASVILAVESEGFVETIVMNLEEIIGNTYEYSTSIDLTNYQSGDYNFTLTILDNAGNSISKTYEVSMVFETYNFGAWLQANLLTVVVPSLSGLLVLIILAVVLAVTVKRRKAVKGWQDAIEAVAYVTKTGLTVLYVPYSKGMFEDEQLFGGAMIGVLGILEEITGQRDSQMNIHIMEFGDKRLVIAPSYFGNAILLVNDVKEQHKIKLQEFVRDFELTYKQELTSEGLLNLNEFDEARLLVESYFGVRKKIEDN